MRVSVPEASQDTRTPTGGQVLWASVSSSVVPSHVTLSQVHGTFSTNVTFIKVHLVVKVNFYTFQNHLEDDHSFRKLFS